ncbi:MOSC domain-containing protein [Dyadobacter tibetensis]|uniref:MOSC domain-containing protein n=1 Tax=Dyadobacter tibetensis TaxID=1211851 RepID=UPI00046ED07B|nr:MOSC N-terminal beta barrel domain-containing protein [Dyadobacter tibetensis]
MILSEIWIYPIKSLGGIRLTEALALERGLQHDRRWMIVDIQGRFLSQRQLPQMALLHTTLESHGIGISRAQKGAILVPFIPRTTHVIPVRVWDDELDAIQVDPEIDQWLSEQLGQTVRLVMMPNDAERRVDPEYAFRQENVSFADGFPYLLISQESLDDLNQKLDSTITMRRFRPNLVVKGFTPFMEDHINTIQIGSLSFQIVKPCSRCNMTTLDPFTAIRGVEPLKTLATYRRVNNKILFGQNMVCRGEGTIREGDHIMIIA